MIHFRHFFSFIFISISSCSPAFSSDLEFIDQKQSKGSFANIPPELFCQIAKHLLVPDILKASEVSRKWHHMFNQEIIWQDIVQTISGYPQYKDLTLPAKRLVINLKAPKFEFLEEFHLPASYKKLVRFYNLLYLDEIIDCLLMNSLICPMAISLTACNINIGRHIITGKLQIKDQNLPFLYLENKGVKLWRDIFSQAGLLPEGYHIEKIMMISEDGTTFIGTGSRSSLWWAYFPEAESFKRLGIKVFDYQEYNALTSLNIQLSSISEGGGAPRSI